MEQQNQQSQQNATNTQKDFQPKKSLAPNKQLYVVAGGLGVTILVILGIFVLVQSNVKERDRIGKGTDGCMITGCSGQICSDEAVITTCEYLPKYACYKNAVCERQSNGKCGWTQTNELVQCLQNKDKRTKQILLETSTWQTYRNEELWFDVRYPKDWRVSEETPYTLFDSADYLGETISSPIVETVNSGTRIIANRYKNPENFTLNQLSADYTTQQNRSAIEVGGMRGVILDTIVEFGVHETVVVLIGEDFIYQIVRTYPESQKSQYEEVFDQMLSTFRFIESEETKSETANWQTYRNEEFGFEFKYPAELRAVSNGPNDAQKNLDRGEMISGTIPPSYDTITFSNPAKQEQFNVVIFPVRKHEVSPAGFKEDYLSLGSVCDTRWLDSVESIIGEPTLLNKNGLSILEAQVISGGITGGSSAGCYYFKNSKGNLIVFNISGFEQKPDFLDIFHFVGDKILSTLVTSTSPTEVTSTSGAETASWKTYRNDTYRFEFQYPESWTVLKSNRPGYPYLFFADLGPRATIQQGGLFGVTVRSQTEEEYLSFLQQEGGLFVLSSHEVMLGNQKATLYTFGRNQSRVDQDLKWKVVVSSRNNFLFEFAQGGTNRQDRSRDPIFNQMLSTFQFVE